MPAEQRKDLFYTCARALTLPLTLGFSTPLHEVPSQILKVDACLGELKGDPAGYRLKVRGSLSVLVRYAKLDGRVALLTGQSFFDLTLPLKEELPSGHLELAAALHDLSYSLSSSWGGKARLEVKALGELNVKVMTVTAPGSLPEGFDWVTVILSEVLDQQEVTFFRELILPLDPPALRILRVEVREEKVKAELLPGPVVSAEAEELVLYLGQDGHVHHLRHLTGWSRFLPSQESFENACLAAEVQGKVTKEEIQAAGHTIQLHITETVSARVKRKRRLQVLAGCDQDPPGDTVPARVRRVVGEVAASRLVTLSLPLAEPVAYLGSPQAEVCELNARPGSGRVLVEGKVEITVPYAGPDGKERTACLHAPFQLFVTADGAKPEHGVEARSRVESVEVVRSQKGAYEVQVFCSFELCLTALEILRLAVNLPSSQRVNETTPVEIEKLVGENQNDQLIEQDVRLEERAEILGEVTALPRNKEVKIANGQVLASGEIEFCAYYITADGRELCASNLVPWQAVLTIAEARPEMTPEVEVACHLLPSVLSSKGTAVTLKAILNVRARVYARTTSRVITTFNPSFSSVPAGEPVEALVCDELELDALVLLPHPPAQKIEEATVAIYRSTYKLEEGAVEAVGELELSILYYGYDRLLRRWEEKRPFAVRLPCPAARPGLTVRGELKIKEARPQLIFIQGARSGREVVVSIVFAADIVLLKMT
ncbi:MAG: hypothetical protein PWP58_598 [Bacillota bacterium]|jgi:hypothetical protein|nr:hypothetical protein [Bacillota bacterium]